MRWGIYILLICAVMGCRSQSTPMTNPFMAPDRVPPPATRTPAPGTAQPYYPSAAAPVVPGAVTPSGVSPGTVFQPASTPTPTFSTPPTSPPLQTAPVTPPGGWSQPATTPYGVPTSNYNSVQATPSDSVAVKINPDDQGLRIASVPNNNPNDILQVAANQQMATTAPYIYTPPATAVQSTQNVIQPVQFASTSLPGAASDGFRPQGSKQTNEAPSVTRPIGVQAPGAPHEDPAHFGFDPTYSWLRGQLQYYPESEQWGLRYITLQGTPDHYGGVAVIANPEVLAGVQPGEFLLVQGFLETEGNFDGTFVPLFTVEGVQRQR